MDEQCKSQLQESKKKIGRNEHGRAVQKSVTRVYEEKQDETNMDEQCKSQLQESTKTNRTKRTWVSSAKVSCKSLRRKTGRNKHGRAVQKSVARVYKGK